MERGKSGRRRKTPSSGTPMSGGSRRSPCSTLVSSQAGARSTSRTAWPRNGNRPVGFVPCAGSTRTQRASDAPIAVRRSVRSSGGGCLRAFVRPAASHGARWPPLRSVRRVSPASGRSTGRSSRSSPRRSSPRRLGPYKGPSTGREPDHVR